MGILDRRIDKTKNVSPVPPRRSRRVVRKVKKSKLPRWVVANAMDLPETGTAKPNIDMGKLKEKRDIEGLIKALVHEKYGEHDGKPYVSERVVNMDVVAALGELRDDKAIAPLVQLLEDPYAMGEVCQGIVWALEHIGSERAIKVLVNALGDRRILQYRPRPAAALARWGMPSGKPNVSDMAALALARIGEPAVEAPTEALEDENEIVPERAKETLEKIQDLYCASCGFKNAGQALFCQECGAALQTTDQEKETLESIQDLYCASCGFKNTGQALFCQECGAALQTTGQEPVLPTTRREPDLQTISQEPVLQTPTREAVPQTTSRESVLRKTTIIESMVQYAGFWRRFGAALIDGILVNVASLPIYFISSWIWPVAEIEGWYVQIGSWIGAIFTTILTWIYYTVMENSSKQATLGKMALGIIVTDRQRRRISFRRATARFFSKILSTIILFIGFIMIPFTKRKQGLHDKIAGTLVLPKR